MAKSNLLILLNLLILSAISIFGITNSNTIDLNPYFLVIEDWSEGHQISNHLYNSYHYWQFDPLLEALLQKYQNPALIPAYCLFFFATGLFILIRSNLEQIHNKSRSNLFGFLILIASGIVSLNIFQRDFILLASLTWFPFYLLSLQNFFAKKLLSLPYLILASSLLILSSNQIAPLVVVMGFIFYRLESQPDSEPRRIYQSLVLGLLIFGATIRIFTLPATIFPYDNTNQTLLLNIASPELTQAIFGTEIPTHFLETLIVNQRFTGLIIFLLIAIIPIALKFKRDTQVHFLCAILILLGFQILLPHQFSSISPLAVINRIIPDWSLFAMPVFYLSILFCFLLIFSLRRGQEIYLCLLLLGLMILSSKEDPALAAANHLHDQSTIHAGRLMNSPAVTLIKHFPEFYSQHLIHINKKRERPIAKLNPIITSNYNQTNLAQLQDQDPNSFWSTQIGKQLGNEWVKIQFPEPHELSAIVLSTTTRHTDFPRGLRITGSMNCQEGQKQTLYEQKAWPGSLLFTRSGYPFFSHPSVVKVQFEKKMLQCLQIEQIGQSEHLEWTIDEIKFVR